MKKIIILTISIFMIFGVAGCSKEQEVVEEPEKKEVVEERREDATIDVSKFYDSQPHILEDLAVKDVKTPTLSITGNRWIYDEQT